MTRAFGRGGMVRGAVGTPWRECAVGHEMVQWRGSGPCWVCCGPGTPALWVL
jgi:hypothetical protein